MTLRRTVLPLFLIALCLLALVPFGSGQTEAATLSGLITDPEGKVVPGVTVEVTNVDTNVSAHQTTNGAGLYVVVGLKPGRYRVSVTRDGFRRIDLTDLVLNVQDVLSRNFQLQLGPVLASITVVADEAKVNTESATVSTVVDRQFAENLPLNGRSFQTLIQLTPGVVLTAVNDGDTGQFSVNGQRASSNYWMVDGVSANAGISVGASPGNGLGGTLGSSSVLGGTNSLVSVDAMQEFRIQTSTYAPEFGRTPGGQISIVTRSGTNQLHGTLFDYLRNDVLDANDWFADQKGLAKPQERQNDFGGTLSGPILKNRTFFFFSYEGLRLRLPKVGETNVPCDSSCKVFGDARALAVPAMQPFLNAYPLPNGPEVFLACDPTDPTCPPTGQKPTGGAQFNASFSNPSTLDAYSIRIDHKLSGNLNLFGRFNYSPSKLAGRSFSQPTSLSTIFSEKINTQTATIGATWGISAVAANDLRLNYSKTDSSSEQLLDSFGGAVPLVSLPFPPSLTARNGLFLLSISSLGNGGSLNIGKNAHNQQRQINVVDSLFVQKASHSMKFGVDYRRLSPQFDPVAYLQEPFFLTVSDSETGNMIFTAVDSSHGATLLFRNLGIFAQDTWRIIPGLTLTYGVRWDVDFVPSSIRGPGFNAVTGFNLNDLSSLALAPPGTPPYKTTYRNLAPRIGLAYQLSPSQDWQSVLRGGFGIFYDLATAEAGNSIQPFSYPFGAQGGVLGLPIGGTATFPLTATQAAPPPVTPPDASNFGALFGFNPNLRLPYTLQWNVALEQTLGRQQTISATYVGSAGRRLLQSAQGFPSGANFSFVSLVTNGAVSNYNAFQLQFQRRISRGLQATASYTWSHSIDTASASSSGTSSNLFVAGFSPNVNRGSSDFDVRNAFSAGVTYDIPTPKISSFTNAVLRGWSTENIIQGRSAPPVDVFYEIFGALANGFLTNTRPDVVPGQPFYLFGNFPGGKAFNSAAFTLPPLDPLTGLPTRQGNLGRNALRGFGAVQWDFAIHRDFFIHDSLKLQFRAEVFNVLNHPSFGQPSGGLGDPSAPDPQFGLSSQTLGQSLSGGTGTGGFDPLYQIGGPRSIQFALKLQF